MPPPTAPSGVYWVDSVNERSPLAINSSGQNAVGQTGFVDSTGQIVVLADGLYPYASNDGGQTWTAGTQYIPTSIPTSQLGIWFDQDNDLAVFWNTSGGGADTDLNVASWNPATRAFTELTEGQWDDNGVGGSADTTYDVVGGYDPGTGDLWLLAVAKDLATTDDGRYLWQRWDPDTEAFITPSPATGGSHIWNSDIEGDTDISGWMSKQLDYDAKTLSVPLTGTVYHHGHNGNRLRDVAYDGTNNDFRETSLVTTVNESGQQAFHKANFWDPTNERFYSVIGWHNNGDAVILKSNGVDPTTGGWTKVWDSTIDESLTDARAAGEIAATYSIIGRKIWVIFLDDTGGAANKTFIVAEFDLDSETSSQTDLGFQGDLDSNSVTMERASYKRWDPAREREVPGFLIKVVPSFSENWLAYYPLGEFGGVASSFGWGRIPIGG